MPSGAVRERKVTAGREEGGGGGGAGVVEKGEKGRAREGNKKEMDRAGDAVSEQLVFFAIHVEGNAPISPHSSLEHTQELHIPVVAASIQLVFSCAYFRLRF